jgi:hypothetical protein
VVEAGHETQKCVRKTDLPLYLLECDRKGGKYGFGIRVRLAEEVMDRG